MPDVVRELIVKLGVDADTSGLRDFAKAEEKVSAKTIALGNVIADGVKALARMAVAAAKAGLAFARDLVFGMAEAGDEIAKTAKKMGVGVEELQRLRFAAERSGASNQVLTVGLKNLQKGLDDARTKGTGPFVEGLDALGLSLDSLQGLNAEERIGVLGDALANVGDDAERTALAMKLFGSRAGAELVPLLAEGTAGIKALGDEAESLGVVMGEDATSQAEAFQDSMTNFQAILTGIKQSIGTELLPIFEKMIKAVGAWIKENRELIKTRVKQFVKGLIEAGKVLGRVLKQIFDVVSSVVDALGGLESTLQIAAVAFTAAKVAAGGLLGVFGLILTAAFALGRKIGETMEGIGRSVRKTVGTLREELAKVQGEIDDTKDELTKRREQLRRENEQATKRREGGFAGTTFLAGEGQLTAEGERLRQEIGKAGDAQIAAAKAAAAKEARKTGADVGDAQSRAVRAVNQRIERNRARAEKAAAEAFAATGSLEAARAAGQEFLEGAIAPSRKPKGGGGGGGGRRKPKENEGAGGPGLTADDLVAQAVNEGASASGLRAAGGGAAPLAGAVINRIDARFMPDIDVSISLPAQSLEGLPPEMQARVVGDAVRDVIDRQFRTAFDHYTEAVQP